MDRWKLQRNTDPVDRGGKAFGRKRLPILQGIPTNVRNCCEVRQANRAARNRPTPSISDPQAKQGTGVGHGESLSGPFSAPLDTGGFGGGQDGVNGLGLAGRGGIFQSQRSAQLQLVPARGRRMPEGESFTPTNVAAPGRQGAELPKSGLAGDLMSVIDEQGDCTLWFCVKGETEGAPSRWAEVLLGPSFDGQA